MAWLNTWGVVMPGGKWSCRGTRTTETARGVPLWGLKCERSSVHVNARGIVPCLGLIRMQVPR
jgi:hypothetical protein